MLKITGTVMIIIAGVLLGVVSVLKAQGRIKALEELEGIVRELKTRVRCTGASIDELIGQMSRENKTGRFLHICTREREGAESFHEGWERACMECLNSRDREAALELGRALGGSDLEGQKQCMDYFLARAGILLDSARKEGERCRKVKMTLYCCGAITLALFMI